MNDDFDWTFYANCLGLDPDIFFPAPGDDMSFAKSICAGCDVRAECLAHAQTHDEVHGIWGGLNARERGRLRSRRFSMRVGKAERVA